MKIGIYIALVFMSFGLYDAMHVYATHNLAIPRTSSIAPGIYKRAATGRYAEFCLPVSVARVAIQSGLEVGSGACPGEIEPVMKPIIRPTPERPLVLSPCGFILDGRTLPNTAPKANARTGAPLSHYPYGTYTSGTWAISSFNRDSYDSRYFGPIAEDRIMFYLKPLITIGKGD